MQAREKLDDQLETLAIDWTTKKSVLLYFTFSLLAASRSEPAKRDVKQSRRNSTDKTQRCCCSLERTREKNSLVCVLRRKKRRKEANYEPRNHQARAGRMWKKHKAKRRHENNNKNLTFNRKKSASVQEQRGQLRSIRRLRTCMSGLVEWSRNNTATSFNVLFDDSTSQLDSSRRAFLRSRLKSKVFFFHVWDCATALSSEIN